MGANQLCDAACHVQKQMVSDNTGKKKSSGCSCLRYNSRKPSREHTPPLKTELTILYISLKALSIPVFVSRPGLSSSTRTLLFASGLTPESGEEPYTFERFADFEENGMSEHQAHPLGF